jgi:hypothetical protein
MMTSSDQIPPTDGSGGGCTTTAASSSSAVRPSSLHDCLALGQVEAALPRSATPSSEEVHRLPVLLRLLQQSRPLSSVPTFPVGFEEQAEKKEEEQGEASQEPDAVIEEVVARLEDRAAMYSAAEAVQMVACHVAPAVCRRMGRLSAIRKKRSGAYDTFDLEAVVASNHPSQVLALGAKRRRASSKPLLSTPVGDDDLAQSGSKMSEDDMGLEEEPPAAESGEKKEPALSGKKRRRRSMHDRESISAVAASEDSQEFAVYKTMQELARLTVQSLQESPGTTADIEEPGETAATAAAEDVDSFSIQMEDSILAVPRQPSQRLADGVGGGATVAGSDLGATAASLMHHLPVLRHDHVAGALCRAAVPQAADVICRMGANCPAAVPCLLRGCLDVHRQAAQVRNHSIVTASAKAVRKLASLSSSEACRVMTTLRQQGDSTMVDLQLDLAMEHDPLAAACLLTEHLSRGHEAEPEAEQNRNLPMQEESTRRKSSVAPPDDASKRCTSSLKRYLEGRSDLLCRTLGFLRGELQFEEKDVVPWGRVSVMLTAYTWLVVLVPVDRLAKSEATCVVESLRGLTDSLKDNLATSKSSLLERPHSLLVAAMVATAALMAAMESSFGEEAAKLVEQILLFPSFSRTADVIVARVLCALKYEDPSSLCVMIGEILCSSTSSFSENDAFTYRLSSLCKLLAEKSEYDSLIDRGMVAEAFQVDPSAAIDLMECEQLPEALRREKTKTVLKIALSDKSVASSFLRSRRSTVFIEYATSFLLKEESAKVPLVFPPQIEGLATTLRLESIGTGGEAEALFLIQLLHSFFFLEHEPDSPFSFDPRVLPLKEVYDSCSMPTVNIHENVRRSLKELIDRHCPEIQKRTQHCRILKSSTHLSAAQLGKVHTEAQKRFLMSMLRKSVADPQSDPNGLVAEQVFITSSRVLCDADLFTTAASALISRPKSPPLFFTYPMLYRDPLTILKCPIGVWKRKGIRKIVLSMLEFLMETNDDVVRSQAPSDDVGAEFLDSRNEVAARCLVSVVTGSSLEADSAKCPCEMTVGFLRKVVARHRGLAAMLMKQNVPEEELDWLIESIPEMMADASALGDLLSERSSLSASERLVAADGIMRIVVAHGQNSSEEHDSLVYAALAQLIAAFFLVMGPVGVPVNTFVAEGTGLDVTQVSRKATFRILKALQNVRGFRTRLKNECSLTLQKLSGLCKGEALTGSLPVAVANRQKTLLKDLLDAVVRAADSMGSGIV